MGCGALPTRRSLKRAKSCFVRSPFLPSVCCHVAQNPSFATKERRALYSPEKRPARRQQHTKFQVECNESRGSSGRPTWRGLDPKPSSHLVLLSRPDADGGASATTKPTLLGRGAAQHRSAPQLYKKEQQPAKRPSSKQLARSQSQHRLPSAPPPRQTSAPKLSLSAAELLPPPPPDELLLQRR